MKKSRAWAWIVGLGLIASLATGCTTVAVLKKEVGPQIKGVIVSAGPHLLEAIVIDIASIFGKGWEIGEVPFEAVGIMPAEITPSTGETPSK
jgi:hypothetical protein